VSGKSYHKEILDSIGELNKQVARIEERTLNIYHLTEKQEVHLSRLNNSILELWKMTISNKTAIFWIRVILISSGLVGGASAGIWKIFN